jgi:hypothetical protein
VQPNLAAQPACQLLVFGSHACEIGRLDEFSQKRGLSHRRHVLAGGQLLDDSPPSLPGSGLNADRPELQDDFTAGHEMRDGASIVSGHGQAFQAKQVA